MEYFFFYEIHTTGRSPFLDSLQHPKQMGLVGAVAASWCSAIYMGFVWLPEYMQEVEKPFVEGALIINR